MSEPVDMVEVWRGTLRESVHRGHAVICDDTGQIVEAWGDPKAVVYPRSSAKMLQALPLVESGAADAFSLSTERLALACASHQGAHIHTDRVQRWLAALDLTDDAFRCGPQTPGDREAREELIRAGESPCRYHNNCSGKHSGFLTLERHIGGGPDYVDPAHPVQKAARAAIEEMAQETSPTYGIDGCSAPNFALTMEGMARAMARYAALHGGSSTRAAAATRLADAMMAHPELVNGEDHACTNLMRAAKGEAAIKGGAEGYYVAILPGRRMGVAVKAADGASRASECMIASMLVRLGVLDAADPVARRYTHPDIRNWDGLVTGHIEPAKTLS